MSQPRNTRGGTDGTDLHTPSPQRKVRFTRDTGSPPPSRSSLHKDARRQSHV